MCYAPSINNRTIIFCETKKECNEIFLEANSKFTCGVLNGDIAQNSRENTI
jgi:superfamily II DNA/RNA helicase